MENRIVKLTEDNNGMLHCACGAEILCDKETGDMPEKCPGLWPGLFSFARS